jgi:outer membrane protein assembly factor BamA
MGPAPYPDAVILHASGLHVGDVYLQGTANRALKRLYATGIFANVGLHADNTKDGLKVSILAQPRPLVKTVTFTGLTPQEEITVRPQLIAEEGRRLSPSDLFHDTGTLQRLLGKNNPADRAVSIHVAYDDGMTQQRDVTIPKATP